LKLVSDDTQKGDTLETVSLVDVGEDPLASFQRIVRRGLSKGGLRERD
jgi:hypothetical protein